VAVVAVVLATTTYARNHDYESIASLMRDTVENSPSNLRARVIYGGHLLAQERYIEAERQLRVAVTLPERSPAEKGLTAAAHMYLGSVLGAEGKFDEAIPVLERTVALSPELGEAHAFLGNVYASKGRLTEAAASFDRAIELMPAIPALLERAAAVHDALAAEHTGAGRETEAQAAAARAEELTTRAAKAKGPG
jgi:tetratricopeptide (TPR) repeat protein